MSSRLSDSFDFIAQLIGKDLYARLPIYNPKVDYIGPEAWTEIKALKPIADLARRSWGIDLNMAGFVHDFLYSVGGDGAARLRADTAFLTMMNFLIEQQSSKVWGVGRIQRNLARAYADRLYSLVRENGTSFFRYDEGAKKC